MGKHKLSALLCVALMALAGTALAAGEKASEGAYARVAGGERVPVVPSRSSPEQWSAKRPKFRSLRPKARSNVE